ncbi:oxidoreductase [Nakamurella deserti]|uniref:oxidoreductase n=1 Tax=Nakamurella deserti TaxID=2164074 RepID=UPI000DBE16A2|nr:oxidoreductase [Nakamurella deserti]
MTAATPRPAWSAHDLHRMEGTTVVVTGASSGLGERNAAELTRAGARVVLAVRDIAKGERVAEAMTGDLEVRWLDLADLASVRAFAADWSGPLDVLINNAGIMAVPEGETADGFEMQIGTNHLGHFALTALLLPHITDRVVTVSSQAHRMGRIHLTDLNAERRRYHRWGAYGQSKLANLLFTSELQRRLELAGSPVRAVAAHPGFAATGLTSHFDGFLGRPLNTLTSLVATSAADGALPTLYAATQDLPGDSFVGPGRNGPQLESRSRAARDDEMARQLFDLSARLTGVEVLSAA